MNYTAFWFRRDLRLRDNTGLSMALASGNPVIPVFIFDKSILDTLKPPYDPRVEFIYKQILELKKELQSLNSDLLVLFGEVEDCWKLIFNKYKVRELFVNRDYESYAIKRDRKIKDLCLKSNVVFQEFKDQIIFEKDEILKEDCKPYVVYTAFKNKLLSKLDHLDDIRNSKYLRTRQFIHQHLFQGSFNIITPTFRDIGFIESGQFFPESRIDETIIKEYDKSRNFPAIFGTTRLGVHLRFGTISIRELFIEAAVLNSTFLNELIWREFYSMILQGFPHVEFSAFKPQYDQIQWENNEILFDAWCNGKTGYPFVDAGMRELNKTGFMHNRLRMVTASFLVKHLLIDWKWGEAYFAQKLLDFDLANNNGGWQWAAGCGTDAAPYFRIFNPVIQQKRFDPQFDYVEKWVPEFRTRDYISPIIEHTYARQRCMSTYRNALLK
jgi:deoxyribodipyrimidine photo-lyase